MIPPIILAKIYGLDEPVEFHEYGTWLKQKEKDPNLAVKPYMYSLIKKFPASEYTFIHNEHYRKMEMAVCLMSGKAQLIKSRDEFELSQESLLEFEKVFRLAKVLPVEDWRSLLSTPEAKKYATLNIFKPETSNEDIKASLDWFTRDGIRAYKALLQEADDRNMNINDPAFKEPFSYE